MSQSLAQGQLARARLERAASSPSHALSTVSHVLVSFVLCLSFPVSNTSLRFRYWGGIGHESSLAVCWGGEGARRWGSEVRDEWLELGGQWEGWRKRRRLCI